MTKAEFLDQLAGDERLGSVPASISVIEYGETLAKGPYVAETFPVHVEDSYVIVET